MITYLGADAVLRRIRTLLADDPLAELADVTEVTSLRQAALEITRRRTLPGVSPALIEATAALQRLALAASPDPAPLLAELTALQSALPAGIQTATDGPYLVTNANRLTTWLGEELPTHPQMALCRCGASATKPFCDGSHSEIAFSGAKDPDRVPDRRDEYPGVDVTVLDNRGICAHSGFCSDRLAAVFRAGSEPFIAPSGGRMDEIVQAVRACPSGALSFAVDGREAREQVDQRNRPPAIEVSKDGPYRVTGSLPLTAADGEPEPRPAGASTEHYSLCRCGQSRNKPFCSGMHWSVDFRDPQRSEQPTATPTPTPTPNPTLFEWVGGLPALERMTRIFYSKYVPEDELLSPLFAEMSPDHPQRVAAWLGETFGGPAAFTRHYGGYDRMVGQHMGKGLTEAQRARWARLIVQAADDAGLPADPEFRAAFVAYIEWGSRIAVENSQPGAHPPPHMPVPRWWWVCEATPDARMSALAESDPESEPEAPPNAANPTAKETPAMPLPGPDEPLSFAAHIQPLFRPKDRQSMKFVFDLWSHDDVTRHAAAIAARLRQGSMPCDGAWPAEQIAVFERWTAAGSPA